MAIFKNDNGTAVKKSGSSPNFVDNFAYVESSVTASKAYNIGEYLVYSGRLYKVIDDISQGDTLSLNSNIALTDVGSELTDVGSELTEVGHYYYKEDNVTVPAGATTLVVDNLISWANLPTDGRYVMLFSITSETTSDIDLLVFQGNATNPGAITRGTTSKLSSTGYRLAVSFSTYAVNGMTNKNIYVHHAVQGNIHIFAQVIRLK